jgi:transposase
VLVLITENMKYSFSKPFKISIPVSISFYHFNFVVYTLRKTIGISKWIKLYSEVKIDDETVITAQQIKDLQKRNAQLEEENLILKKAIAIFTPHSGND